MLLIIGILTGFAVAAPVGPVGLLCLRRSITDGRLVGFITGLGAAVADALMALVVVLGVSTITSFIATHAMLFRCVSSLLLLGMGIGAILIQPKERSTKGALHAPNLHMAFYSAIALTIANPVTIGSLLVIFTAFGVMVHVNGWMAPSWLVIGVFIGSTTWWAILSTCAEWFGRKLNTHLLRTINIATGIILIVFGCYHLGKLLLCAL
jgi:threonine/homoserine/homoserine lactone efflux protein